MSIALDHPRTTAFRAPEPRFGLARGEKLSNIDEDVRALQRIGVKTHIARNETIFNEGDEARYAYKVVSGAVRLCKHMADGRRQIADFLLPGDFFGFLQFGFYSFTAEAVGDVVVMCYPQRQLEQISSSTPSLRKRILVLLSQRLLGLQDHLVMLGRQTAKERLASFLIRLAERTQVEDDDALELPMSRQDIADYLGLTIETVCRVLSQFKRDKLIGIPDLHHVVPKDLEALYAIAEGDEGI